jgi:ABC-type transport system substrate-binding protein
LRSLIQEAEEIAADQVPFIPLFALPMWWLRSTDLLGWGDNPNMWAAQYLYRADS